MIVGEEKENELDRQWVVKFEELKKYKEENGHCRVPQRYSSLGSWVAHQRYVFRHRPGHRQDRHNKLKSIGFDFDTDCLASQRK